MQALISELRSVREQIRIVGGGVACGAGFMALGLFVLSGPFGG